MVRDDFDSVSEAFTIVMMALTATGGVAKLSLLYAILRVGLYRTPSERAALVPTVGMSFYGLGAATTYAISLYIRGFQSSPFGEVACQIQGVVITASIGMAFTGHFVLAVERYHRFVLNRELTLRAMQALTALQVAAIIGICWYSASRFRLFTGGIYCYFALSSSAPELRIPSIICVSYCFTILFGITFCYGMIYLRARNLFRRDSPSVGVTRQKGAEEMTAENLHATNLSTYNNHETGVAGDTVQQAVLFRCLVVLVAFVIFYAPSFSVFLYELITGESFPSRIFALVATVMVGIDSSYTSTKSTKTQSRGTCSLINLKIWFIRLRPEAGPIRKPWPTAHSMPLKGELEKGIEMRDLLGTVQLCVGTQMQEVAEDA